jgi:hypothetical protein
VKKYLNWSACVYTALELNDAGMPEAAEVIDLQLNYVRMPEELEVLDLSTYLPHHIQTADLLSVKNLHSHLVFGQLMLSHYRRERAREGRREERLGNTVTRIQS